MFQKLHIRWGEKNLTQVQRANNIVNYNNVTEKNLKVTQMSFSRKIIFQMAVYSHNTGNTTWMLKISELSPHEKRISKQY
jgi:hypothetical protein